jgi:hypothetical protein
MIAVIIPIRDRYDYRVENAIRSVRGQSGGVVGKDGIVMPIEIMLVDYGSKETHKEEFERLVADYSLTGIWTGIEGPWNKSHCLNIALKRTNAEYVQVCDVDIIFAPDYFEVFTKEISLNPKQMLYCNMLDLEEGEVAGLIDYPAEYARLKNKAEYRGKKPGMGEKSALGSSILFVCRDYFFSVGGYDERYELWGDEDWDILKRFELMGVALTNMSHATSHLHQWHPRFENVGTVEGFEEKVKDNRRYFLENNSVVRNAGKWGEL